MRFNGGPNAGETDLNQTDLNQSSLLLNSIVLWIASFCILQKPVSEFDFKTELSNDVVVRELEIATF
jgi:hypothetical protein